MTTYGGARREAPWTDEEVRSLEAYQGAGYVHPFTGTEGDILVPTREGWRVHRSGPVVQTWAHAFMCDWTWRGALGVDP